MLAFLENGRSLRICWKMISDLVPIYKQGVFFHRTALHPQKVQIIMYVCVTTGLTILSVLHHSRHRHSFNDFFLETKVS